MLALALWLMQRLVAQVDELAKRVGEINVENMKTTTRLEAFENYAQDGSNWKERIVRIESHLKLKSH